MLLKSEIKYIQSFANKRERDQHGLFIAEGTKLVLDILNQTTVRVHKLYSLGEWITQHKKNTAHVEVIQITNAELARISCMVTPQQVVALVEKPALSEPHVNEMGITLVLDGIQDPGNMGTIVRIADWYGIKNIICSRSTVDVFNPKVVQATMGSITRVNVYYVDLFNFLPTANVPIYATLLQGTPINKVGHIEQGLLLIGNEGRGIDEKLLEIPGIKKITIPGGGGAESLNAAVATGIILSHITAY